MRLAISLSSVLLPQPDGPIRVRNSPSAIVRSIGASPRVPLAENFLGREHLHSRRPLAAGRHWSGAFVERLGRATARSCPSLI